MRRNVTALVTGALTVLTWVFILVISLAVAIANRETKTTRHQAMEVEEALRALPISR